MIKAIVTGHSRGLGAAIAADLLSRNIPVLGLARSRNADLEKRFPGALEQAELDLADSAAVTRWLDGDTLRRFVAGCNTVVLVNNAGTVQPVGPLDTLQPAAIVQAVALNVAAPMMLAAAIPATAERRIVHLSSGAARNPYSGWSVYCATKAALDQHARAAALERTPGLRICSLAPGVVDTGMQAEIRASTLEEFPLRGRFEELKRGGQLASPEDCARRLVDYVLGEKFGQFAVADLRD